MEKQKEPDFKLISVLGKNFPVYPIQGLIEAPNAQEPIRKRFLKEFDTFGLSAFLLYPTIIEFSVYFSLLLREVGVDLDQSVHTSFKIIAVGVSVWHPQPVQLISDTFKDLILLL